MKIKISGVKRFFSNLIGNAVSHFTFSLIIFFLIAVLIGAIVFYKYVFLAQEKAKENVDSFLSIKEFAHQEVLKFWQEQEQRLNETNLREYPDPFKKPVIQKSPVKK